MKLGKILELLQLMKLMKLSQKVSQMTISSRYPVMVEMVDDVDKREDGGDEDDERDDDKSRDGKGVLEKFFCGSPLQASFNSINCPMPHFNFISSPTRRNSVPKTS